MEPRALLGVKLLVGISAGLSGLVFNSWIVHVNAKDWRRGVHLSLPDQILTFMGLINITLQAVLSFDMSFIHTKLYTSFDQIHLSILGFVMFLVSSNMWLIAWISIYYCMRIVNFTDGILFIFKMRISTFLPKLLVVSTVATFIMSFASFWNIYPLRNQEVTGNSTRNLTKEQTSILVKSPYLIVVLLECILPLILTLIPIGLTLSSLWRHLKRMNMNKSDACQPRTQAHVRAARTMVFLVTLHTGLIAASIYILSKTFNFNNVLMLFCWYFILFFPTGQALVIITGSAKLRKASKGAITCHMFSKKRLYLH